MVQYTCKISKNKNIFKYHFLKTYVTPYNVVFFIFWSTNNKTANVFLNEVHLLINSNLRGIITDICYYIHILLKILSIFSIHWEYNGYIEYLIDIMSKYWESNRYAENIIDIMKI